MEAIHVLLTREAIKQHFYCKRISTNFYGCNFNIDSDNQDQPNLFMAYVVDKGTLEATIFCLSDYNEGHNGVKYADRTEVLAISAPDLQERIAELVTYLHILCNQGPKQSR